ncbi:hypothetical protein BC938DRAFT_482991 [Jimgerdemannia flammicorona]|uniref:F-box domain-containing protein n=1 Tax=Jimgerdemannia flammicorona TaxID=994334 RepID=A0A433QCT1_9FUNG|nr:hypothetical protein BC938DRAFT_482991 [Jimgerdemannia flammicorona]
MTESKANSLPPELICEILRHVLTLREHIPIDLFACSMVSQKWYKEAVPLFDLEFFESPFIGRFISLFRGTPNPDAVDYSCAEVERFSKLLAESKKLGLPQYKKIKELVFRAQFTTVAEFNSLLEAFVSIFELRPPYLQELTIDLLALRFPDVLEDCDFQRMFDRLQPLCGAIKSFTITWAIGIPHPTGLVAFFSALAPNLQFVELQNVHVDLALSASLSRCTDLRYFYLQMCNTEALHFAIPSMPGLISINYLHNGQNADLSVATLAASCPSLATFSFANYFLGPVATNSVTSTSLSQLIANCPKMCEFDVLNDTGVDDAVLQSLLRYGRELQRICLFMCPNLTGENVNITEGDGWPMLEQFLLNECDELSGEFVEKVMAVCPRLQKLKLPYHLNYDETWLTPYGFRYTKNNVWIKQ